MKSISIFLFSFLLLNGIDIIAQTRQYETNPDRKRANIWVLGQQALIDFNVFPPQSKDSCKIESLEGVACISDTFGKLLFYTNGITVWNKNNDTMEGGFKLMGKYSSTQAAIIIKAYNNDSIYYIVTTPNVTDKNIGLRYNIVNIRLNGGLGKVIKKNIILSEVSTEKITATFHQNQKDVWIIGHTFKDNNFYTTLVKDEGFISCPIASSVGSTISYLYNGQGYLKLSHNSKFLVNTIMYDKQIEIFHFSNLTGKIQFYKAIKFDFMPYGLEFSSNDSNLFITGLLGDTNYVSVINIYTNLSRPINSYKLGQIQSIQMMNDEIYLAYADSSNLKTIDNINKYLFADFNNNKIINLLPPQRSSYGLPNFNQSYFYTPSIEFAYNYDCINNSIAFEGRDTFYADTHQWTIGKNFNTIEATYTSKQITHVFKDTGNYLIRYIASKDNRNDTIIKSISIFPKISKNFLGKDTAYETGTNFIKTLLAPIGMHCYYWLNDSSGSNTFNADSAGTYICKITSQSFCEVWDTIVISNCINDLAVPTLKRIRDSLLVSHFLADSFVWFRNNVLYKVTKEPFLALIDTGSYRVEAAKKGHCSKFSDIYKVQILNILSPFLLYDPVYIYPNPASEQISIEFDVQGTYSIQLLNSLGQLVHSTLTSDTTNLNLNGLPAGVYLLAISNAENKLFYYKLIKE